MTEEMIYSIIDDIAHDAKVIIAEHLHPESVELVDSLKQSAKDWDGAREKVSRVFRDLEDDLRAYFEKNRDRIVDETGSGDADESEFCVGDEVLFIGNGCAVKDKIVNVLVETEEGFMVNTDDIFRSMDELVERLKEDVDG